MANMVDVFWSFRSPYSYLVTADLLKLREDYDVHVRLRPVLPIALRAKSTIFDASDKKRPRYIVMDARRRAEFLGLPFVWPKPDPVVQDRETFKVPEEQPLIWRLTGLGVVAENLGMFDLPSRDRLIRSRGWCFLGLSPALSLGSTTVPLSRSTP